MSQPMASPDNIDITSLFASIRKKLPRVLLCALAAAILTYTALSMVAPHYSSQTELTIRAKGATNPFSGPRIDGGSSQVQPSKIDKQAVNTHVRALHSPDLAAKIIKELRLNRLPEFNSALGPQDAMGRLLAAIGFGAHDPSESESDRVQRAFFERLKVYSPSESRIITIAFSSTDPQLAAKIANLVAENYRERLANSTVVETDAVQTALEPKIKHLSKEVTQAQAAVARFRSKAGLLRGGSQKTPLNQQQLGDLTTELTRASASRSALQAGATSARDLIRRGNPEIIPQVQRSPLIQNLIQQRVTVERDLRKYSATMKSAHPVIRQLNADLRSVKRQVSVEVANLVASIDKEAHVAIEREASIKRSLETLKARVADTNDDEVELGRLEAVAKSKRSELARLQAQFEANRARADSGVVPVEAEIVTVARPSSVPSYPRKGPYTALLAAATLLFGLAWTITSALLKNARPQASQADAMRNEIAMVAAKEVPTLAKADLAHAPQTELAHIHTVATPRELAAHLKQIASKTHSTCRSMIVSSSNDLRTAELARDLGDVLNGPLANAIIIDWNTNGNALVLKSDGRSMAKGMTDLLAGTAQFSDVVRALPGSKTHFIAGGQPLQDGKEIVPQKLNMVLDALDAAYSQIIIVCEREQAKKLFETIEGRIDAGVLVDQVGANHTPASNGTFLGYAVDGLSVFHYAKPTVPAKAARKSPVISTKRNGDQSDQHRAHTT